MTQPRNQPHPADQYERQLHRLERRARRRRSNYRLLVIFILMGVMMLMVVELGRTLAYSQDVGNFLTTLEERTPEQIKADLYRYAAGFRDHNPVIRKASMTAFKVATRETLGDEAEAWRTWWIEHQMEWQYTPAPPKP